MPQTTIHVFRERNGKVPLIEWIEVLEKRERRAHAKCLDMILLLASYGQELREPYSKPLSKGIRELRWRIGTVNYRILYFFCGKNAACLSHGFTKESKVPPEDIELAIQRKRLLEKARDRDRHLAEWDY